MAKAINKKMSKMSRTHSEEMRKMLSFQRLEEVFR